MKDLSRKLVNRMVDKTSSNGGGGNSYVPQSQAVSWTDIDGKPTTLAGYGITDAYWATNQSTSDKRNLTIGNVTQQVITAHQSLSGYATEQWVGQQGYLTSSALNGYATESWVTGRGYITSSGSCAYATSAGNADTVDGYHESAFLHLTGGTMTGNIYIGNTTIYASGSNGGINSLAVADDCILGDCNIGGHLGLKSLNTTYAGISFYSSGGSQMGQITALNGNVGIGTDSPSYKLHVAGVIYSTSGNKSLSDIRKKNIIDYNQKLSVEDIANAPLIHYTLKDSDDKSVHVGSIAQYWEKKLPETVAKDENDTLSMQYDVQAHTAAIVLARKVVELQNEIEELKKLIK